MGEGLEYKKKREGPREKEIRKARLYLGHMGLKTISARSDSSGSGIVDFWGICARGHVVLLST